MAVKSRIRKKNESVLAIIALAPKLVSLPALAHFGCPEGLMNDA